MRMKNVRYKILVNQIANNISNTLNICLNTLFSLRILFLMVFYFYSFYGHSNLRVNLYTLTNDYFGSLIFIYISFI